MVGLPLIKLGTLALKQISKPIANTIKQGAKNSTTFKNGILFPAQVYHRFEQTIRMRTLGWGGKVDIKPLNEQMAVDLGADLIGEAVVFGVAVLCLYAEYRRGQSKDQAKEAVQNKKLKSLQDQIVTLGLELEKQSTQMRELSRLHPSLNSGGKS